jgi:hypothetical protein
VPVSDAVLEGELVLPEGATGVILFVHGSGSGRHSPRNRLVAHTLNEAGIGTLLADLLTEGEEEVDRVTGELRFEWFSRYLRRDDGGRSGDPVTRGRARDLPVRGLSDEPARHRPGHREEERRGT